MKYTVKRWGGINTVGMKGVVIWRGVTKTRLTVAIDMEFIVLLYRYMFHYLLY